LTIPRASATSGRLPVVTNLAAADRALQREIDRREAEVIVGIAEVCRRH
jgi:hypothetical protein